MTGVEEERQLFTRDIDIGVSAALVGMLRSHRSGAMADALPAPYDAMAIVAGALGATIRFYMQSEPHPEELTAHEVIQVLFPLVKAYAEQTIAMARKRVEQ